MYWRECIGHNVLEKLAKKVFSCSTMFVLNAAMLFFLVMAGWALTLQWMLWGQLLLLGHFELCALQLAQELWRQEAPSSRAGCKDFCTLCLQRVNWLLIMGWIIAGLKGFQLSTFRKFQSLSPSKQASIGVVLEPLLSLNESCRAPTAEMPEQSAPPGRSECIFQDVWVCPLLIWQDMAFCSQRLAKGWEAFRASQDHSVYVQPPLKFLGNSWKESSSKVQCQAPRTIPATKDRLFAGVGSKVSFEFNSCCSRNSAATPWPPHQKGCNLETIEQSLGNI